MTAPNYKQQAAERAVADVSSGMKLGLGTGSTAALFVEALARRVATGLDVFCVPTSEATRRQAEALGLRVGTLDDEPLLDLTVDGADEIDPELRLIKGGGGAHLREKIVATASARMIVIAEAIKKVDVLGRFPLPVEVVPFGLAATRNTIALLAGDVGCRGEIVLRTSADGSVFRTDGGNLILDLAFGRIPDPDDLAEALERIPGVVEHGLFIGLCDRAILAGPGGLEIIDAPEDP